MQELRFVCPLPPSVNNYLGKRVAYNPINNRYFVQVYETSEAKAYKKHMKKVLERAVKQYSWNKTGEFTYVVCELDVYLSQKRRDTDNMFKCLLDCFTENGLIYDDSMIIPRIREVYIDTNDPRVEVKLSISEKIGVFKNQNELDLFLRDYCEKCTRYSRNCSILRASKENKIKNEIINDENGNRTCGAFKGKKG